MVNMFGLIGDGGEMRAQKLYYQHVIMILMNISLILHRLQFSVPRQTNLLILIIKELY